jgi:hypothetical protein
VVPGTDGQSALLIFSDSLEPDDAKLMAKVTGTKVQFRPVAGPVSDLKWTDQKESFKLASPDGKAGLVNANLKYGVVAKGDTPFLLHYCASAWLPGPAKEPLPALQADEQLPLQIVPRGGRKFQALWQGKPLAETVVTLIGGDKPVEVKSDVQGSFELPKEVSGLLGLRIRQIEAKGGELDGKAYKETRHYATLVVRVK